VRIKCTADHGVWWRFEWSDRYGSRWYFISYNSTGSRNYEDWDAARQAWLRMHCTK